jgi:hypothetical protein
MFLCHGGVIHVICQGKWADTKPHRIKSGRQASEDSIFQDQHLITTFFVPSYLYPFWPEATTKFQSLARGAGLSTPHFNETDFLHPLLAMMKFGLKQKKKISAFYSSL